MRLPPSMVNAQIMPMLLDASREEREGRWPEALRLYQESFRRTAAAGDSATMVEIVVRQSYCLRHSGDFESAEEMFTLGEAMGRAAGRGDIVARCLNGLGMLQQASRYLDEAEELFESARSFAIQAQNESILGDIENNLGITANIRGQLSNSLLFYQSAVKRLERVGNQRGVVGTLNNLAMLHIDTGDLEAADDYFRRSLAVCEAAGEVVMAGGVHINRAELFVARGEYERARQSCDAGFETFARNGDGLRIAEALKFYGIIYRQTGKLHLAENHLRQAIEIAAERDPLLEGEAQRELALVMRALRRNRESLEALNRAHLLFSRMHAEPDHRDVKERIAELEGDFLSLVQEWGSSIEAKDRYTLGHCQRVSDIACLLAARAGVDEREIVWFRMGAFLHDVGKTEVPEEVLNKAGPLTEAERLLMERHPQLGDEMLAPLGFPWDVRPMVRSHHERWDGRGYPDRLAGAAIPRTARILRLADIFDALTSTRSYRQPLEPEEAFAIMEEDVGSFDPELFELFRELFPQISELARSALGRGEPSVV